MKAITTTIFFFFTVCMSFAQSDCDTAQIYTDPQKPIPSTEVDKKEYWKNLWDWRRSTYPINKNGYSDYRPIGTLPLQSPFNSGPAEYISSIAKGVNSDNKPSDGWELVKVDMGFGYFNRPNLANPLKKRDVALPFTAFNPQGDTGIMSLIPTAYFLLYNRFSGKLRLFIVNEMMAEADPNVLRMMISLENPLGDSTYNASGIFAHYGPYSVALDKDTERETGFIMSVSPAARAGWAFGDFQMAYDPCTCKFPSVFRFNFEKYYRSTATLYGDLVLDQANEVEDFLNILTQQGQPYGYDANDDYLFSYHGIVNQNSGAINFRSAIQNYKSIDSLIQHFRARVNTTQSENISLEGFKAILSAGSSLAATSSTPEGAALAAGLEILGTAIDFFSASFGENSQPTIATGRMKMEGTIERITKQEGWDFVLGVPGSRDTKKYFEHFTNDAHSWPAYPTYNRPLGVFGMLYTPKYDEYWVNTKQTLSTGVIVPPGGILILFRNTTRTKISYKLDEDVIYALNPDLKITLNNSDSNSSIVKAKFVVEFDELPNLPISYSPTGVDILVDTFVNKINTNLKPNPINSRVFESEYVNIRALKDKSVFIDVATSVRQGINGVGTTYTFDRDKIKLYIKISAVFQAKDRDGKIRLVPFLAKYPIELGEGRSFNRAYGDGVAEGEPDQLDLKITAPLTNYTQDKTLSAVRSVEIGGNVLVAPGKKLTVQTEKLILKDGATITGNLELKGVLDIVLGHNTTLNITDTKLLALRSLLIKGILNVPVDTFEFIAPSIKHPESLPPWDPNYVLVNVGDHFKRRYSLPHEKNSTPTQRLFISRPIEATPAQIDQFCANQTNGYKALNFATSSPINPSPEDTTTSTSSPNKPTAQTVLGYAHPNPTELKATIPFFLGEASFAKIYLTDVVGGNQVVLFEGSLPSGQHSVELDASRLSSGVYFYTLETQTVKQTKRLVIAR